MAQQQDPQQALRQNVQDLLDEMAQDKHPSFKDLQDYLQRKDALIGGGQHHVKRNVTRGQIMGDLQRWLDDPNH
jgi:hypothetical protein